jgi:hypothetical protein
LELAFACLNKKKSLYPKTFERILEELSIESPTDLKDVEVRTLIAIAGILKPIPSETFMKAIPSVISSNVALDFVTVIASSKLPENADLELAFACLNKKKSLYCKTFEVMLEELSIEASTDLKDVEVRTLIAIAGLLKPVPSETFMKALKLDSINLN